MPTPCPFLPSCGRPLSWRDLNALRDDQGPELYRLCLEYGQQLWLDDLPARALLAVDRALYCDVPGDAEVLTEYAMPYRAIGWMVRQPSESFTGNARVHYQHLADRVRGERADLKKWRAWAAWAVTRHVRPDLTGDPKHIVIEPTPAEIEAGLRAHGVNGEIAEWHKALADLTTALFSMTLHADHSLRIVVDATDLHAGLTGERQLEQREVPSESRITLRSLKAGEAWKHDGGKLLEVLVVRGRLSLNGETLGPASYARLAPGVPASFEATEAGLVYLNERTPMEPEKDSYALRGEELDWRQGMVPGLKVTSLHQGLTKHTALVRWAPETRFNPHTHVGGEEILVLEGVFRDEHGSYPAGTWIRSPHLSNHRPFTGPEGATILVKVGHLDVA